MGLDIGTAPRAEARGAAARRVPQHIGLAAAGAAVLIDQVQVAAGQFLAEFPGIGDGRRAGDEDGGGAVVGAEAGEAAQELGHVRTEDAAIHVQFVEHQEAQVGQEPGPARVLGHDAGVEHVGVGEDDRALVAQTAAEVGRGVAVENAGQPVVEPGGLEQVAEVFELVLAEGLGGKEEQDGGLGIGPQDFDDGQGVAEGLARGGAGGHQHVLSLADLADGFGLVAVQGVDVKVRE